VQNTWTWNGSNWTQRNPATTPPPLYFTTGAFDPMLNQVVVFGGGSVGVDQNTTWAWDGLNWTLLSPTASPSRREGFGTVWDEAHREFLIFGGDLFPNGKLFGDMWKFSVN
jgi:hypothetical protein